MSHNDQHLKKKKGLKSFTFLWNEYTKVLLFEKNMKTV